MKSKSIRLTGTSYALLALIQEYGQATSYEIKQTMEHSIENFWSVPHTTAYEEPARLAAAGYLEARQEDGGRRRRIYSLTDAGRQALAEWANEPTAAPPQLREEAVLKVFAGGDPKKLLEQRVAWHRAKVEELQSYLAAVRNTEGFARSERTLLTGIAYHKKMLELMDLMEQLRAADPDS
jgi:DNA-binding PadR family transcriptional regulator